MILDVTEKEAQLIQYFRTISRFNRERVFSMARNAADDFKRAEKIRDYLGAAEQK
ncbi:hypothetical protein DESUT3_39090 [Desulfuromonas versatilis]|uniref:Uncharacterized protein n=1 Tax=Desulfuromonas versatilis TaxID=2802975 RepID=A0ABM8I1U3_9BACT|nr:hypothetical protein [Desulfuromonas versatilis]BCR06840.1 hypothetical protein DESUT3_39090 [Desulfuromonas versatilis]